MTNKERLLRRERQLTEQLQRTQDELEIVQRQLLIEHHLDLLRKQALKEANLQ